MDALLRVSARPPVDSVFTSVQPSETNERSSESRAERVERLRSSVAGIKRASELSVAPPPKFWPDTRHQRWIHEKVQRVRAHVIACIASDDDPALQRRLKRLEGCCCCPMFAAKSDGTVGVAPGFCRDRLCPTCQQQRGREVSQRIGAIAESMDQVRFLTLTVKHSAAPLAEQLGDLYAAFKLLRRRPEWKAHVRGGVAVCEVKLGRDGESWHPHLHVLIDGTYFPHATIKRVWAEITGDSSIVHIKAMHSRQAAAKYVGTYVAKPADVLSLRPGQLCEYASALHGRRLVVAFGSMHGRLSDGEDCNERPRLCEPLASAAQVLGALHRGCPYGEFAARVLGRLGGMYARALGLHVRGDAQGSGAPDAGDHQQLRVALRRIAGDSSAWLPIVEPARRFAGRDNRGRERTPVVLRLFEPDPHSGRLVPCSS